DLAIPVPPVHGLCFEEHTVRVEPQRLDPGLARKRFQLVQDPAGDALCPRPSGVVHIRLISPTRLSMRRGPPQPTTRPSIRARTKKPLGGVISSSDAGSPSRGLKPPSKRAASSRKYAARHRRVAALFGETTSTSIVAVRISCSISAIAARR